MGHNLTRREGRECHPVVYAVLDTHVRSVGNCTAEQHQIGSISEILQNSCAPIAGRNAMIFGQRDDIGGRNPQGLGAAFKDGSTRYGMHAHTGRSQGTGLRRTAYDDQFALRGRDLPDEIPNSTKYGIRTIDRRNDHRQLDGIRAHLACAARLTTPVRSSSASFIAAQFAMDGVGRCLAAILWMRGRSCGLPHRLKRSASRRPRTTREVRSVSGLRGAI
jgi:hypothetical protein